MQGTCPRRDHRPCQRADRPLPPEEPESPHRHPLGPAAPSPERKAAEMLREERFAPKGAMRGYRALMVNHLFLVWPFVSTSIDAGPIGYGPSFFFMSIASFRS